MAFKAMRFDEVNKGLRVEKRRGSQTEIQSILRFRSSGKEKEKKKKIRKKGQRHGRKIKRVQ